MLYLDFESSFIVYNCFKLLVVAKISYYKLKKRHVSIAKVGN